MINKLWQILKGKLISTEVTEEEGFIVKKKSFKISISFGKNAIPLLHIGHTWSEKHDDKFKDNYISSQQQQDQTN